MKRRRHTSTEKLSQEDLFKIKRNHESIRMLGAVSIYTIIVPRIRIAS